MDNNQPTEPRNQQISTQVENGRSQNLFNTPLSAQGWPKWLVYTLGGIGLIYLINPTAGLLEFLPDNLPFIGNLDEGVATLLVISGIVELIESRKKRG